MPIWTLIAMLRQRILKIIYSEESTNSYIAIQDKLLCLLLNSWKLTTLLTTALL